MLSISVNSGLKRNACQNLRGIIARWLESLLRWDENAGKLHSIWEHLCSKMRLLLMYHIPPPRPTLCDSLYSNLTRIGSIRRMICALLDQSVLAICKIKKIPRQSSGRRKECCLNEQVPRKETFRVLLNRRTLPDGKILELHILQQIQDSTDRHSQGETEHTAIVFQVRHVFLGSNVQNSRRQYQQFHRLDNTMKNIIFHDESTVNGYFSLTKAHNGKECACRIQKAISIRIGG